MEVFLEHGEDNAPELSPLQICMKGLEGGLWSRRAQRLQQLQKSASLFQDRSL